MLTLGALISMLALGQSLLCANLLVMRAYHRAVYWPLAAFFLANTFSEVGAVLDAPMFESLSGVWSGLFTVLTLIADFLLPPLFWLYVRALTSESENSWVKRDMYHFLPAVVVMCGLIAVVLALEPLKSTKIASRSLLAWLYIGLVVVWLGQCCFYVALITRRLIGYHKRLMDLFSTTKGRELKWIGGIVVLIVGYVAFIAILFALNVITNLDATLDVWASLLDAALIWGLALWGLRQKPGLVDEVAAMESVVSNNLASKSLESKSLESKNLEAAPTSSGKYEKSGLGEDQASRIAEKIEAAMTDDNIYINPELSLSALSKHIGVMPNYVSQSLNTQLGETFFDYINKWRVKAAMERLKSSEDTVLAIAYEVGFNSRSSFYNAFKRVNGQTPSAYRNSL